MRAVQGVRGILRATGKQAERQEVAWACARALRPRASVLLSRGGRRQGGRWWAGPASCGAGPDGALGGAAGKSRKTFLSLFLLLFPIFCNCVWIY